jgi:hypothetical protein
MWQFTGAAVRWFVDIRCFSASGPLQSRLDKSGECMLSDDFLGALSVVHGRKRCSKKVAKAGPGRSGNKKEKSCGYRPR